MTLTEILAETKRAIQEADETLSRGNFGAYVSLIARESKQQQRSPSTGHAMTVIDVSLGKNAPEEQTMDEVALADERRLAEEYRALRKQAEAKLSPVLETVKGLFPSLKERIENYFSHPDDLRELEHRSLKGLMEYMLEILDAVPADYHPQTLFPVARKDITQTRERYSETSLDGVKELPYRDEVITELKSRQVSLNASWEFVQDIKLGNLECTVSHYALVDIPEEQGGRDKARYKGVLARVYQKDGEGKYRNRKKQSG